MRTGHKPPQTASQRCQIDPNPITCTANENPPQRRVFAVAGCPLNEIQAVMTAQLPVYVINLPESTARRESIEQQAERLGLDRKSTRLNSSHVAISYAVFCLKKKNEINI